MVTNQDGDEVLTMCAVLLFRRRQPAREAAPVA
jgi:hypothetical protein